MDAIFSIQHTRTVMDDYTFQYANDRYQIVKKSTQAGLRRSRIAIENRLDETQRIGWRKQYLRCSKIEPENIKKLARRVGATPVGLRTPSVAPTREKKKHAPNHPWKRLWKPDISELR